MLQNGYLSDIQNAILVSVENQDAAKSAQLQQHLTDTINSVFQGGSLEGAVLSQTVTESADLNALAQQYGISVGKASLIQEVIAQDSTLTFASLAPLSVNEIALIAESRHLTTQAVTQTAPPAQRPISRQRRPKMPPWLMRASPRAAWPSWRSSSTARTA